MDKRPDWPEYFLVLAEAASTRATCPRATCGAVVVGEGNRVLGTGYNGAPPGSDHCLDYGCMMEDGHCQRAIHAEVNAILHSAPGIRGSTVYVHINSHHGQGHQGACRECQKVLRAAGVRTVVTRSESGVRSHDLANPTTEA